MNYQPPYTITPEIVNLVAEIGETIGRYTVLAEQNLTPRLRRENRIHDIGDCKPDHTLDTLSDIRDVISAKTSNAVLSFR